MRIFPVRRVDALLDSGPWPWAEANRDRIAANWDRRRAEKPALFNGIVLVSTRVSLVDDTLEVRLREADYASFLAMIDFGFPEPGVGNCFGAAVLRAADGAVLLGEMAAHTVNGGRVYFPGGNLDRSDVRADGRVDIEASIRRELEEETGLAPPDVVFANSFTAVIDGARTALLKEARSPLDAPALCARVDAFIAKQAESELAGIRSVTSAAGIDPAIMPAYVSGYLRGAFPPPRDIGRSDNQTG